MVNNFMKNFLIRACHKFSSIFYENKYHNIFTRDESRDIFAQEENKKIIWPQNKKFVCNIQFDDFCAKSKDNGPYDFGGSFGAGINLAFDSFLAAHPEVQVTIFATPHPTFRNYKGIYYGNTDDLFNLSNPEYKNVVEWMKAKKDRVEIACHGYTHIQRAIPFFLGPAEFEFSSVNDAKKSIVKALDIFARLHQYLQIAHLFSPMFHANYDKPFPIRIALQLRPNIFFPLPEFPVYQKYF